MMKKTFTLIFLVLGLIGLQSHAQVESWESKVDETLIEKLQTGSAPFIIMLKEQADLSGAKNIRGKVNKATFVHHELSKLAERTQQPLLEILETNGKTYQRLFIVNVIQTEGNLELVRLIASRSDVANIQDNPYVQFDSPRAEQNSGARVLEWGLTKIQADKVWEMGHRGADVVIGGQDTGYEWEHPALMTKYRGYDATGEADHNYNWHDAIHEFSPLHDTQENPCGLDSPVPCDDNNHGTHTMGTMVGSDGENEIGVAPDAKWCACRNMERGWGSPISYIECFEWFVAPTDLNGENPDPSKGPHVIANSWGCPEIEGCFPSNFAMMNLAVENLRAAGTVVVVSAGNSGSECNSITNPAAIFEGSFTVGAVAINDTIANFSSRGSVEVDSSGRMKPNISAPGVQVRSSVRGGVYATFSGTSMSGPHVAGVVALMISANPELAGEVDIIEDIIETTAIPATSDEECGGVTGDMIPNNTYGFGRIDALAAVEKAMTIFPVNVLEIQEEFVTVFPNPTDDYINFNFTNISEDVILEVRDVTGRLVYINKFNSAKESTLSFNVSSISGMYFYNIRYQDKVLSGKFVKR